jgi:hypothetical protein
MEPSQALEHPHRGCGLTSRACREGLDPLGEGGRSYANGTVGDLGADLGSLAVFGAAARSWGWGRGRARIFWGVVPRGGVGGRLFESGVPGGDVVLIVDARGVVVRRGVAGRDRLLMGAVRRRVVGVQGSRFDGAAGEDEREKRKPESAHGLTEYLQL